MAAAKEPAKRSHAAVSNLKDIVENRGKRLGNLLEEKALGVYAHCVSTGRMAPAYLSPSKTRDYELKDTLINVILKAQEDQKEMDDWGLKQTSKSKPTAFAVYQSAKSNIVSSRELLGHYERASQQVAAGEGVPMMGSAWEKDSRTLQHILDKQREKIKLEVHTLLNEDPKSSEEKVEGDRSESDTDLWNRFVVGEAGEENVEALDGRKRETWGVVAKNAQRGVRRTTKYLPEDGK